MHLNIPIGRTRSAPGTVLGSAQRTVNETDENPCPKHLPNHRVHSRGPHDLPQMRACRRKERGARAEAQDDSSPSAFPRGPGSHSLPTREPGDGEVLVFGSSTFRGPGSETVSLPTHCVNSAPRRRTPGVAWPCP